VAKGRPKTKRSLSPRQKALVVAKAAASRKGEDLVILNVSRVTSLTDYFVITHGSSTRQAQAIAESIRNAIANCGSKPLGLEGEREARWILIDWGEVIAHIFHEPTREFYELEKLWADARRLKYPPNTRTTKRKSAKKK
jgi:ribosome-associated protein